ncbi:cytochrome P450 [Rhodococcus qingshengii]|uniref:cytochrome P450 n=1 Tax=Rhodococcus qingshengii TaxID=334542 RepID=UPI0024BB55DC|nr:cytochrome P450 [Rhodococcus qingshengii]MDJ0441202.1 cytochrome P450 [Rhodococcus qingshengii]
MTLAHDDRRHLLNDLVWWHSNASERAALFEDFRRQTPRVFVPFNSSENSTTKGYWAITSHADVFQVSRRPEDFGSGEGTQIFDQPEELRDYLGSIIDMDNPKHARLRKIVSRGFTAKSIDSIRDDVEAVVAEVLDEMPGSGTCDFVEQFAALVPLRIVNRLLGIPREHEKFIFDATNIILGAYDPEYIPDQTPAGIGKAISAASKALIELLQDLAKDRIACPRDDLITKLVAAEEEENLTPQEMAQFFILLVGAGNETTRNAISHGLYVLSEHPDQRETLISDYDEYSGRAIEEILRWATPVVHMRRTVTRDGVMLEDQEFRRGDKVVMWYNSANRDEDVFERPGEFDIHRFHNPHLTFGAPGPHFCLGANLARLELEIAFRELYLRFPDIRSVGKPVMLRSNFLNGIKHLEVAY